MESSRKKVLFNLFVLFGSVIGFGSAAQHKFLENFIVDYNIINNDKSIEFKIQAINITGWVGIGIWNGTGDNYDGSDLFIGGVTQGSWEPYGNDFYTKLGAKGIPTQDPTQFQNWNIIEIYENNNSTNVHVTRLLDTGDTSYDHVIGNEQVHFLYMCNLRSDDVTQKYNYAGSNFINIYRNGGGKGGSNSTASYVASIGMKTMIATSLVAITGFRT